MAEHVNISLVDELKDTLDLLHKQPELDARDRHSIFIMNDMLANLSFMRDRQSALLDAMMSDDYSKE